MKETLKRSARTFVQSFLGVFMAMSMSGTVGVDGVPDYAILKRAAVAALWAGVVALISFTQNALEETGAVKPVLK